MTHVLPRIFPTNPRIRYRNVIHESVVIDGAEHLYSVMSPILVRHKGYTTAMMDAREKNERNRPLLERAIREAAGDAFSWFNFGISAISAGDFEVGIESLERMFAMPGPQRAFFPIGYVMLASAFADGRKDVERAIAILDEGLTHSPGHPNIVFTRGHLLAQLGRYDEARTAYDEVMAGRVQRGAPLDGRRRDLDLEGAPQRRHDLRQRAALRRSGAVVRARVRQQAGLRAAARLDGVGVRARRPVLRRRTDCFVKRPNATVRPASPSTSTI